MRLLMSPTHILDLMVVSTEDTIESSQSRLIIFYYELKAFFAWWTRSIENNFKSQTNQHISAPLEALFLCKAPEVFGKSLLHKQRIMAQRAVEKPTSTSNDT